MIFFVDASIPIATVCNAVYSATSLNDPSTARADDAVVLFQTLYFLDQVLYKEYCTLEDVELELALFLLLFAIRTVGFRRYF